MCIASGLTAARGTKRRVHIAPLRALNEQLSWFLLLSCSLHVLSSVLALFCVVRAEQRRVDASRVTVTVARVNFLNGGVLKLDVTRAMYISLCCVDVADLDYLENGEHGGGLRF
jgi:hypothetical protein